ncbi:MAG: hypothetical protein AAFY71_05610 [Bacteroidota bacterium]
MSLTISSSAWKRLYKLASSFQTLAPWSWMLEMDLFGVEHPQSREVGYCCILGPERGNEGLAVYKGLPGLASYEHLFDGDADMPAISVIYEQNCLVLLFLSETELYDRERELFSLYGDQPVHNKYPVFRDYSPGWVPWPIHEEFQAAWMEVALEQALEVALRFKSDEDLLDHMTNREPSLLVRRPVNPPFLDVWRDDWIPLQPLQEDKQATNKLYLRSNLAEFLPRARAWIATVFYDPNPKENHLQRPYLPLVVLIADYTLGEIIYHKEFEPGNETQSIQKAFVEAVRKAQYLPTKLYVGELKEFHTWEEIGHILKIAIQLDKGGKIAGELQQEYLN